ncbi:MAG TPA: flagellar assembly protein FliW [Bryobacteraceae bacterium]|nr:flagellar assembly protein FliW [Bryobacteraceae bacterium]
MPSLETKYFGSMEYREESVYEFPHGLPAFESETRFVLIERPENKPLVFLQSLSRPNLCFLALPIWAIDRDYQLEISPEDLEELSLGPERQPALGSEVLALALISLHDNFSPTANLMAPVVVHLKTRQGLQAIRQDSRYSHEHPIQPASAEGAC